MRKLRPSFSLKDSQLKLIAPESDRSSGLRCFQKEGNSVAIPPSFLNAFWAARMGMCHYLDRISLVAKRISLYFPSLHGDWSACSACQFAANVGIAVSHQLTTMRADLKQMQH
jgi:hypothetical protein